MTDEPKKLPVPSWAIAMVSNYRRSQNLGPHITDEHIFARVEEWRGANKEDVEAAVGDLREELPG